MKIDQDSTENIKRIIIALTHVEDFDAGQLPHISYINEKMRTSFVNLDSKNRQRFYDYLRKWNISEFEELGEIKKTP